MLLIWKIAAEAIAFDMLIALVLIAQPGPLYQDAPRWAEEMDR